jgi:predicted RNA-binding Zn ribbon-like protein
LLQLFVNSYDDLTQKETIGTPEQLSRWLRRRGFDPGPRPLRSADVARLRRVREALRAVFAFHNGGALPDPDALALLNSEGLRNRIATAFSSAGRAVVASHTVGAAGLLSSLFAAAVAGTEQGMWERLKACPECGWVFYDHSRNGRGSWCTMTICGSRAKMRAYRRRRSAGRGK